MPPATSEQATPLYRVELSGAAPIMPQVCAVTGAPATALHRLWHTRYGFATDALVARTLDLPFSADGLARYRAALPRFTEIMQRGTVCCLTVPVLGGVLAAGWCLVWTCYGFWLYLLDSAQQRRRLCVLHALNKPTPTRTSSPYILDMSVPSWGFVQEFLRLNPAARLVTREVGGAAAGRRAPGETNLREQLLLIADVGYLPSVVGTPQGAMGGKLHVTTERLTWDPGRGLGARIGRLGVPEYRRWEVPVSEIAEVMPTNPQQKVFGSHPFSIRMKDGQVYCCGTMSGSSAMKQRRDEILAAIERAMATQAGPRPSG